MCLILLKAKLCYQKLFSVFNRQTIGRVDEMKISVHELICCKVTNKEKRCSLNAVIENVK